MGKLYRPNFFSLIDLTKNIQYNFQINIISAYKCNNHNYFQQLCLYQQ